MDAKKQPLEQRLMTEQETALYISMSRSFLRTARMTGRLQNRTAAPPFIRIGRAIRYSIDDLNAWIAENRQGEPVGASRG